MKNEVGVQRRGSRATSEVVVRGRGSKTKAHLLVYLAFSLLPRLFFTTSLVFALYLPVEAAPEWVTYTVKDGLASGKTQAIWVEEEEVWVATAGGVSVYTPKTKRWESFSEKDGLPSKDVRCFAENRGVLYAGTAKGLAVFDRTKKQWQRVNLLEGDGAEPVNALLFEGTTLWIGLDSGLLIFDRVKGTGKLLTTEHGLVDNTVRALAANGEQVYIGTVGAALHAYDRVRRKIRVYTPKKQIFTNIVLEVERNRVWSGTNGGGIRVYNRTTGEWKIVTMKEGISDDFLQSICVDGQYVWVGTFDGVSRYDTTSGNWVSFGVKEGLVDGSVTTMAVDGEFIWFGTDDGVSVYHKGYPQVRLDLPTTSIITKNKNEPLIIPVMIRSSSPVREAVAEYSTASFPDIWTSQGLRLTESGGGWLLQWDVTTIPTDFETLFVRVKVKDAREQTNEAVGSVQVDTEPVEVTLDPLPSDLRPGVWTVGGSVNKATVEEVTLEPGRVKARVDRMRKRYSALISLNPDVLEVKVTATDMFGRSGSASQPVKFGGVEAATIETQVETQVISGTSVRLRISEKLLFSSGQADLKGEAQSVLQKVGEVVARNPRTLVRVEGHTDNVLLGKGAKFRDNMELSQARAKGVYDFLLGQGTIAPGRLSMVGYGDTRPMAPNTTEEGRAQNRRVDIMIEVEE